MSQYDFPGARDRMVKQQLEARGITDLAVLEAMSQVPRERFVSPEYADLAYDDCPLPIGLGQTISQPYVVAFMIQSLSLTSGDFVLEVGTGSGYAAAVLSHIAARVITVERIVALADEAAIKLALLGYDNVTVHSADGTLGWRESAPYDAIIVAAGGPSIPESLKNQLDRKGRLVMPVGQYPRTQQLVRLRRLASGGFETDRLSFVRFVPLIGEEGWDEGKGLD